MGFPEDAARPLMILIASQFLLFIGVGAVIPSIPLYGKEIGLSSAANGVVISAPAVALLLGARSAGEYADRARKPAMLVGMAVIAISDIGTALANGLTMLVIARLGLGAGRCISESGERGFLADLSKRAPDQRGRALSAQQAAVALGIAIGAPFGGYIVEMYGPRASFLCVSAAAVVTLVIYCFLPETVEVPDSSTKVGTTIATIREPSKGEWSKLLALNEWRGLSLCQSGATFGFAAKVASIPVLAAAVLPGGAIGAGTLLSAAGLAGIVGAPVGGWLTDRTSARQTVISSGLVSATGLLLVPVALSLPASYDTSVRLWGDMGVDGAAFSAAVILWSLGASSQGPALTALGQELAPDGAEATSIALPRAVGDGTYIIAPFLLGLVTDKVPQTPGVECAVAAVFMLGGAFALAILDQKDQGSFVEH